jgi:hypothetical protein
VPVEFLTDAQSATYGCYACPPSVAELDRYFLLDDKARGLVESKRLPHTRLGYGVQLTTLLFIGTFLADPTDVPTEVVDYLAEQLDIADPSCVKAYRVREMTRLDARLHAEGYPVRDEDAVRLSPYMRRHLNVHGHYSFLLPDLAGARRALRDPDASEGDDEDR